MKARSLVSFVLVALTASVSSQSSARTPVRIAGAPGHATLDMATGVLTRDKQNKAAHLVIVWANTDYSGYYSTPSSPGEEWLDWGVLSVTSGSDIVGAYQFAYGTTVLDTTAGGPGAAPCTSFYDGALGWCAESGQGTVPDAQYCFSGLPGSTSTAVAAGWIITVNLTGGSEFQQGAGPFGYAMSFTDTNTGPLLEYAGSSGGGYDANGQEDAFDIYVPDVASGTCGTYWFGGVPLNFSSWWLYLATADASGTCLCSTYCGTGVNANGFTVLAGPCLGDTFIGSVTAVGSNVGAFLAAYSTPLTLMTNWGEILVNIADPNGELLGLPTAFGNPATISITMPLNLAFTGFPFYVQAIGFGGSIHLHCAYWCVVAS